MRMHGFLQLNTVLMKKKKKKKLKKKMMIDDKNPNQNQDQDQQHLETDRLSNLPIDLRRIILALIPFKEAVRTSTLSSAWRRASHSLLPRIDSLVLDDNAATSVKNVLLRRLEIPSPAHITESHPRAALRDLILGRGLEELVLGSGSLPLPLPWVPKLVLRSRSLRFLDVRCCRMPRSPATCSLTNLKTLKLERASIDDSLLCNIVSSCKFLSRLELVLCDLLRVCQIHSPSLKHLVLRPSRWLHRISIDAPSMRTLTLYTRPRVENLVILAPRVRKAFLHLADPVSDWGIGVEEFLAGSSELACLILRGSSTTLLFTGNAMDESYPTSFRMLKSLSLSMMFDLIYTWMYCSSYSRAVQMFRI